MRIPVLQTIYHRSYESGRMIFALHLLPDNKKAIIIDSECTKSEWKEILNERYGLVIGLPEAAALEISTDITMACEQMDIGAIIIYGLKHYIHYDIQKTEEYFYDIMQSTGVPVYFIEQHSREV